MSASISGIARAHNNLFPGVGDYISDGDSLYRVESVDSGVQTRSQRDYEYIHVTVDEVAWDDCAADDQHPSPFVRGGEVHA